ncbi:glycosyltransferase family 2 protein [Candidatus Enterovibrio escicola]|uniref:Lipopolysaccharide biosynthesis glycosyltransferase n=1 Tax=Candidatus Enterovibrio escicola TaxID=1927127 RepID=A0A2A5T4R7_9GAMM|nr:glycosyltransferase family 2 protein [Candidatus Enterovibrio escacola]PCS23141.1 Lipopolysaccharide biosynthesis glycosyltransferase [Candidatus Enterovibrio escacola]
MKHSQQRASISAIVITKNEELILPECLASLDWVDEIIVVDSGSTDKTVMIAKNSGAKVYVTVEWFGFGKQKQLAQSYATKDWILAIDADEVVSLKLKNRLLSMLKNPPKNTLVEVNELTWVFGRFLRHSGWYYSHVRVYPRDFTQYDDALVHEKVIVPHNAKTIVIDAELLHYSYRDLTHYLVKSASYAKAWADTRQDKREKISIGQGIIHAIGCFLRMYVLKLGFLDGKQGFLIALLSAHSTFIKYAHLWVLNNDSRVH